MNKNEFYMVLPSNSSMDYYPSNTASRYTTLLPKQVELPGEWVVALSEIQFPCNFLHIHDKTEAKLLLTSGFIMDSLKEGVKVPVRVIPKTGYASRAVYNGIDDIILDCNDDEEMKKHLTFRYNNVTGFVSIWRSCHEKTVGSCKNLTHSLHLSEKLSAILGFPAEELRLNRYMDNVTGERPASLARGLPESLFVYSDLCTPYITGDVQSSLLRIVPFSAAGYTYGAKHCATFHTPHYIPVIRSSFRTIEIDIRGNNGQLIPFEYGPLNVTLHFKRVD